MNALETNINYLYWKFEHLIGTRYFKQKLAMLTYNSMNLGGIIEVTTLKEIWSAINNYVMFNYSK